MGKRALRSGYPPILVTGAHRSGTTWIGQMLSLPERVAYIHEPFNMVYKPSGYGIQPNHWFQYIYDGNEEAFYQQVQRTLAFKPIRFKDANFQQLKDGKIFLKRNYQFLKFRLQKKQPLVKDPLAIFSAPWLYKTFQFQPLIVIRHPAAFVFSIIKQGWRFDFNTLIQQERLMTDWLAPYQTELRDAEGKKWSPVAEATLLWKIIHHAIASFQQQYPTWLFIKHEDVAQYPEETFHFLYDVLRLPFSHKAAKTIRAYTQSDETAQRKVSNPVNHIKRDSQALTYAWKEGLAQEDQAYILEETKTLKSKWYDD